MVLYNFQYITKNKIFKQQIIKTFFLTTKVTKDFAEKKLNKDNKEKIFKFS